MIEKTDNEKRSREILKRLLDSFPCGKCDKFKKYERELNSAKMGTQYGSVNEKFSDAIKFSHDNFLNHLEEKHLPSKEEWNIINKS